MAVTAGHVSLPGACRAAASRRIATPRYTKPSTQGLQQLRAAPPKQKRAATASLAKLSGGVTCPSPHPALSLGSAPDGPLLIPRQPWVAPGASKRPRETLPSFKKPPEASGRLPEAFRRRSGPPDPARGLPDLSGLPLRLADAAASGSHPDAPEGLLQKACGPDTKPPQKTDSSKLMSWTETSHLWERRWAVGEVYMETGKPWCVIRGVWPGDPLSQPLEGFPDHTPQTTQQRCPVSL